MHSYSGIRTTHSAGEVNQQSLTPYHRPLTVSNAVDKSSILWKDFLAGVRKRKLLIRKLNDAANESSASISIIKKALLDLRQQTLIVIEDALEIEYRSRMDMTKVTKGALKNARLPPISSFKAMEEKEDIFSLVDMMSDLDDLFHIPNIRVMLPATFPEHRNPFMMGKTVDEMATITPPHPEPGNVEEELKVLELLRYKRASRALLRAEAQVANRLPVTLHDVEKILTRMTDDFNLERLLRCACTLLDNEHTEYANEPNLSCLLIPVFNLEAHEFLNRLNAFKGVRPIRIDAQISVRSSLREANLDYFDDPTVQYLLDWLDIVLNPSKGMTGSAEPQPERSRGPSTTPSRLNKSSLETISEVEWQGTSEINPFHPSSSYVAQPIPNIVGRNQRNQLPYFMQGDDDLISEVGSKGYVHTHENIHVEERPKSKMQKRQDSIPSPPRSPPPPRLPLEVLHKRGGGSHQKIQSQPQIMSFSKPSSHDVSVGADEEIEDETDREQVQKHSDEVKTEQKEEAIPKRNRKKMAPKIMRDDDDEDSIKQNAPGILRRKIRAEVERAINEVGLGKGSGRAGHLGNGDDLPSGTDVLSSVRYELNKMQQELLRRQVLDPRHYAINSVDAINHASKGLTVADINAFGLTGKKRKKASQDDGGVMGSVTLLERNIDASTPIGDTKLLITIILDMDNMELRCIVHCSREDAFRHKLIDELPLGTDNKNINIEIATTRVSRLVFSKVADHTMDELVRATADVKRKMLQNVSGILDKMVEDAVVPHGDLVFPVNRSLLNKRYSEDSVLVDLLISRNDDCNGVVIRVTPLAGLFHANVGPIILHMSDDELEVLMISQHSLFEKGMEKWNSMETVAQWLANKVVLKKVATTTTRPVATATRRNVSSASGKLTSSLLRSLDVGRTSTIREDDNESVQSQLTLSARDDDDDAISVNTDTMMANPKVLLLLDVKINRKIEIAPTLLDTWRATNVPKLIGLNLLIDTWQDLDVMVIGLKLMVPSRKTHKRLMHDAKRNKYDDDDENASRASGEGGNQGLMDMDNYSDDGNYDYDTGDPIVIDFEYRLTRAELLAFGATSIVDHKKISITKNRKTENDEHPENMIWNVFNRLRINFAGSNADPYKSTASAVDPANWSLTYDRQILRDVKTVSNTAVILTILVHGGELLIEGERVESKQSSKIGSKRVSEEELQTFVYEEGYNLSLLRYQRRKELANHILNSLKLVEDAEFPRRLELYTYVESKMIMIALAATAHDPEEELGAIEINSHHTLNDVRIMMKYEFEIHQVPSQFRFIYKGAECSLRQEAFRRAWECLPTLNIVSKASVTKEIGTETEDIAQKRLLAKPKKIAVEHITRVPKGMRRMPGKYAPIPIPTLCAVTEGKNQVFLLHNGANLLNQGDIIRIGNVASRDYVVLSVGFQGEGDILNMQMIEIDPVYDLIGEPDFHLPTQSNLAWPQKHAGTVMKDFVKRVRIVKRPGEWGFIYNWEGEKNIKPVSIVREATTTEGLTAPNKLTITNGGVDANTSMVFQDSATLMSPSKLNASTTMLGPPIDNANITAKTGGMLENSTAVAADDSSVHSQDGGTMVVGTSTNDLIPGTNRKNKKKMKIRKFTDCWIWKCIPAEEDQRLKWRQNYDDGIVRYDYEFGQSEEFCWHFRVKAWYSYLEVLCTDSRIPEFTIHHQRVNEMPSISLDYYTKLAFDRVTDWTPSYKKGIERMKFIKLVKDVNAFPDLKRPARISQLDMYFQKVVRSDYGIVQKYINYQGFCYLLKLIALVRFPPKRKREKEDGEDAKEENEEGSVGGGGGAKGKESGGQDDDDHSQVNDDASVGSMDSETSLKGNNNEKANPTGKNSSKGVSSNGKKERSKKKSGGKNRGKNKEDAVALDTVDPTRHIDIEHVNYAYQKFILDYIMMYPTWYDAPWRDAKLMAMQKEAIRYCAATRISAAWRGHFHRHEYIFFLQQHIKLQANIRRKISARKTRDMIALLEEDWYFRQRYYYATIITKIVRRFLKRCWYHRMLDSIRRQQVLLLKARRQKFKQIKDTTKKTKMYSEAKRISGVFVVINVYRKDPRNFTKDFGVIILVYVPVSQQTVTFVVEDDELRSYMAVALEVEVVNTGQILDRRNLKTMIGQRLIVHKASKKSAHPIISFSKHALGQRGEKTMTCGKRIMGHMFVAKIFETVEDVAVQLYHQITSKIFTCVMEVHELRAWIREEQFVTARANGDELLENTDPIELHPKRKIEFYDWILKHLVIDTRRGIFKVVWSNQYEKSKKREMIIKIQSVWRRALVRPLIVARLDKFMLKVKLSAWDDSCYYINLDNGATQWEKPKLLGPRDLPTVPIRRWVPVNYPNSAKQYYVNPFTGKFTSLVPERAARIIQSLIRNHLLKAIRMTRENYLKAGKIFMQAEKQYEMLHTQHKLSVVINYALYKHVLEIDETNAKDIYREAVELSESNPLVTRAYAFYMLATCEHPIQLNRDRALILLLDARRKDAENVKFATAYAIFQFAVLRQPRDFRTLINLAMVHSMLYSENYKAEKLLRRALAIAPFEERVIEIWKFLKDRFPERHLVYNPKSRVHQMNQSKNVPVAKRKVIHGRPVIENIEWGGWVFVEDDIYHVSKVFKTGSYWYNPADGTETDDLPDFKEEWRIRRARSQWIGEEFGMDQYYDPLTAEYFQHHTLTDTYS